MISLKTKAIKLVTERIKGKRICDGITPLYLHSLRVGLLLEVYGFDSDIQIAGILHDLIEDSDTSIEELHSLGFSKKTLNIVKLCTHNKLLKDCETQRDDLIRQIIKGKNADVRAVKIADTIDNIEDPISKDTNIRTQYLLRRCTVYTYYGLIYLGETQLYAYFLEKLLEASNKINQYSFIDHR